MALRLRLCVLLLVLVWAQETALRHEPKVRRALLSRPSGRRLGWRPRKRSGKGGFVPYIPKPVDPVTNVRPGSSGGRPDSGVLYGSGNGPQGVEKKDSVMTIPGHGILVVHENVFVFGACGFAVCCSCCVLVTVVCREQCKEEEEQCKVAVFLVALFGSCCAGCTVIFVTICCCERCCKEKDQEGPEASPSPSRQLEDGVLPVPPSLPREREHSQPPLPVTKQLLGISAAYVLEIFPALARRRAGLENPSFYEMAPVVAIGETGLGYGLICSEDGKPNCSIVDAVAEHHKGKVTYFVSWCWACRLNDFVGALRAWMERDRINAREAYLWICFFCNNQYRLPKSGTLFSSANELQTVLETRLAKAGQMLFLVDAETTCTTRAWCLFEVFTCVDKQLPITIIMLPATREGLQEAFSTIDLRTARATSKADEDMISEVVLTSAGFDAASARVRGCLLECLKHCSSHSQIEKSPSGDGSKGFIILLDGMNIHLPAIGVHPVPGF